jgi:MFS family permease
LAPAHRKLTTFEEAREHLGMETQRQWNELAIARSTPCLLALFSLIALFVRRLLSATLLGWAVGGVIAGVLTDYIGRRRMLMLSIL